MAMTDREKLDYILKAHHDDLQNYPQWARTLDAVREIVQMEAAERWHQDGQTPTLPPLELDGETSIHVPTTDGETEQVVVAGKVGGETMPDLTTEEAPKKKRGRPKKAAAEPATATVPAEALSNESWAPKDNMPAAEAPAPPPAPADAPTNENNSDASSRAEFQLMNRVKMATNAVLSYISADLMRQRGVLGDERYYRVYEALKAKTQELKKK